MPGLVSPSRTRRRDAERARPHQFGSPEPTLNVRPKSETGQPFTCTARPGRTVTRRPWMGRRTTAAVTHDLNRGSRAPAQVTGRGNLSVPSGRVHGQPIDSVADARADCSVSSLHLSVTLATPPGQQDGGHVRVTRRVLRRCLPDSAIARMSPSFERRSLPQRRSDGAVQKRCRVARRSCKLAHSESARCPEWRDPAA